MDVVILTGASSALGQAISRKLLNQGFKVYGFGGDYSQCDLKNIDFIPVECDLSDPKSIDRAAREILEKERGIHAIVHNAKFYPKNRFLETHGELLERSLRINLLCPLILTQIFARSLAEIQGHIVQIGPTNSDRGQGGVIGTAAASGLRGMVNALFDELREFGVRVCYLSPEPNNRASQNRRLPDPLKEATIDLDVVGDAVAHLVSNTKGNIITEMVIRPTREEPRGIEPVRTLPYPPPKPIPYTVPREEIEAEEIIEEQEYQKSVAKKKEKRKKKREEKNSVAKDSLQNNDVKSSDKVESKQPTEKPQADKEKPAASQNSNQSSRRRRRGRKPRPAAHQPNVNQPTGGTSISGDEATSSPASASASVKNDLRNPRNKMAERRAKRKARQSEQIHSSEKDAPVEKNPSETVSSEAKTPKKKSAKKAPKKAPKKATKKAAKSVAKKAVKKATKKAVKKAAKKATRKKVSTETS